MFFFENLLAIEMKKTQLFITKPVYLGLSILEISKIVMYEFWYDYVKPKYRQKEKLYHKDTNIYSLHKKKRTFTHIIEKILK